MFACEPGKVVFYYQQENLCAGLILSVLDQRCQVLATDGSELHFAVNRFVLVSQNPLSSPDIESLNQFQQAQFELANALSVAEISYNLQALEAPFSFADACASLDYSDDLHVFALFTFLKQHEDLLLCKKGLYRFRFADELGQYARGQQLLQERANYLQSIESYLSTLQKGSAAELSKELGSKFLSELRELTLSPEHKDLARLLRSNAPNEDPLNQIFELRLLLQDITPNTDPVAARSGLPIRFADDLWRAAVTPQAPINENVEAFTIDAEDSPDRDDAISLQVVDQGYILGVHISDVAAQIPMDSLLFAEAVNRVASLYLPGESVPLLPEELSHSTFSLIQGELRPVLSLYARLDAEYRLQSWEFRSEQIRVARNMSYNEVDKLLQDVTFASLLKISRKLQLERGSSQTDPKARYSWHLKVRDGDIRVQRIDNLSPSRFIVEELMILYNRLLAEQATKQEIPLIFRNITRFVEDEDDENAAVLGSQAYLSTEGKFHPGIGALAYVHATSPIRRVTDIINQYQFEALLASSDAPFGRKELEELINRIDKRLLLLRSVAHRSERYWLLRFLESKHLNAPLDAVLVKKLRHGYLAELTRWEKRIVLQCEDRPPLQVPVMLVIAKVDLEEQTVQGDVIL